MFLSILIPTYNHICVDLVVSLQRQCDVLLNQHDALHHRRDASLTAYEIIVMDDCSPQADTVATNDAINSIRRCRHLRLTANLGRAEIRNRLVAAAAGEWCLIIDSDARVTRPDFILRYLCAAREATPETGIIAGGLTNPATLPSPDATLRYRYETDADRHRTLSYRNAHPQLHFSTFNFLARRAVLLAVPFAATIRQYGYEDTLMGIELHRRGIIISHIDNPLEHTGFEPNPIFLGKTETALQTLRYHAPQLMPHTPLGRTAMRLTRLHAAWLPRLLFMLTKPLLAANLNSRRPSLLAFKLYKLGYFLSLPTSPSPH